MNGIVFDLAEASIHDGPGLRVTVFLKGCPLRCRWCHSPEGQRPEPEPMHAAGEDRVCGKTYSPEALANYLNELRPLLRGGGVTFSGGEPLSQATFLGEVLDRLSGIHTILDTCGYAPEGDFRNIVRKVSTVFLGLKLLDPEQAKRWTGQGNSIVLDNLRWLDTESATPYRLRIPLLHGVTDTPENLAALAKLTRTLGRLERIDFLRSNPNAAAKYPAADRTFSPGFDIESPGILPPDFSPGVPFKLLDEQEIE